MSSIPANSPPPRHFQFRLVTLLLATSWVAIISTALKSPNAMWEALICGTTILSLPVAILVSIYRSGRTRAIALGYLTFCGVYVFYYDMPRLTQTALWAGFGSARWSWTDSPPLLVYYALHGEPGPPPQNTGGLFGEPVALVFVFLAIFHHALACLLGLAGAIAAQILYATRKEERQ